MPSLGTLTVTTYRQDTDSNEYALPGNSVSSKDTIALRRTLPSAKPGAIDPGVLRTNMRCERHFTVGTVKKPVTVNISAVVPVGIDLVELQAYLDDVIEPAVVSLNFAAMVKSGDIYLGD